MMARHLFVGLLLGWIGLTGLLPAVQGPLTGQQLQAKAKQASKDKVCAKVRKSNQLKALCEKWGKA
jgi:membrane protease subunit (stomatin/prohibitin family)